jgi:hypothetical protein
MLAEVESEIATERDVLEALEAADRDGAGS